MNQKTGSYEIVNETEYKEYSFLTLSEFNRD